MDAVVSYSIMFFVVSICFEVPVKSRCGQHSLTGEFPTSGLFTQNLLEAHYCHPVVSKRRSLAYLHCHLVYEVYPMLLRVFVQSNKCCKHRCFSFELSTEKQNK